eukprot:154168-Rhodomonas_salina.1
MEQEHNSMDVVSQWVFLYEKQSVYPAPHPHNAGCLQLTLTAVCGCTLRASCRHQWGAGRKKGLRESRWPR